MQSALLYELIEIYIYIGWGSKVLAGILRGSKSEKVRRASVESTHNTCRYLKQPFWDTLISILVKYGYILAKTCSFKYGTGKAYVISEAGSEVLYHVGLEDVLAVLKHDQRILM